MKKLVLSLLAVLLLLSLGPIPTVSAAAAVNKTVVCALETDYAETPGKVWFTDNGNMMHVRGQTTSARIEPLPGHPECINRYSQGELVMSVSFDLNLATGKGFSWGNSTQSISGINGAFVGPFWGKIEGYMFMGTSLTAGTGALKSLIQKVSIQQNGENTYEVHGYVYGQ
jgi:hypothetical protein